MENTFTYTARSASNPDRVVTLTLHDHQLSLQLGMPLQLGESEKSEDAELLLRLKEEARRWLRPMALWVLERRLRPFDVRDVAAGASDEGFWLAAWLRLAGLKLVPIVIALPHVDNPEGAQDFVDRLEERQGAAKSTAGLWGPLDFWATWLGAALLVLALGRRKHRA